MSARASTAHAFAAPTFVERNWDDLQFKAIFAVIFPIYLVVAVGARFAPSHWRKGALHRSIFAEAVEASGTTARMAFAG